MYDNVAGVLALTAGVDTEDPLLLHDFQVFSNFQIFRDHADISNPVVKKLLFDWINFDNYDAKTPFNGEVSSIEFICVYLRLSWNTLTFLCRCGLPRSTWSRRGR